MREKYIDEKVGLWFIFGENPATGLVDVNDGQRDVFTDLPRPLAEDLCELHEDFRNNLYRLLAKHTRGTP